MLKQLLNLSRKTEHLSFDMFVYLCLTSHRQRGHLETAPPFNVPCERRT